MGDRSSDGVNRVWSDERKPQGRARQGRRTVSPGSGGVLAGGRRWRVARSNAYARAIRRGSENAGPENVTPDGNGFATIPSGGRNPPGTVMLG